MILMIKMESIIYTNRSSVGKVQRDKKLLKYCEIFV